MPNFQNQTPFPRMPLRSLIGLILVAFSGVVANAQESVPDQTRERPQQFDRPMLIEIKGPIDQKLAMYFNNRFEKVKSQKADLLIVEIGQPGRFEVRKSRDSSQTSRLQIRLYGCHYPE